MNTLKYLMNKMTRKVGVTLLVFILAMGAILTPFVAMNEYLKHPISITYDIIFGDVFKIELGGNINVKVLQYKAEIEKWTAKEKNGYYDLSPYENVILALMMTESGGNGNDPMQASECGKNTRYSHKPNSIADPKYSIECGVKNFADAMSRATSQGLTGSDALYAAIDGYNKGFGVISKHAEVGHCSLETSCKFCYDHRFSDQKKSYSTAATLKSQYNLKANNYWDGGSWRWNYGNMFYVYKVLSYLKISDDTVIPYDGTLGSMIAAEAQKKIGCRYWYGEEGPDYFDCSGLVYWCCKQAGMSITREGANTYSKMGKAIAYKDLKPGDVVTFDWDNDNKAEHIGIYIGGGFMIHAHGDSYVHGNYAKFVVEKKNICSGYYHDHIFRCRRLY